MNRQPTIRVCAALLAALLCAAPGPARATGKIRSVDIYDQEGVHSFTNQPVTLAAGDTFRVRFRLVNLGWAQTVADASYANPWEFRYTGPLTGDAEADARTMAEAEKPRLGLWFGGQLREADCVNWPMGVASDWLADRLDGERHYTDLVFEYTVRPGDLAWPVQLANEAGTGPADQDDRLYLKCNGRETLWKMVDARTGSVTNELAFGPEALYDDPDFAGEDLRKWSDVNSSEYENRDYDLNGAGVHVRGVDFDPAFFDGAAGVWRSIAQGSTAAEPAAPSIRIGNDDGDGALDPLVFYLWTVDSNVAELVAGGAVDDVRSSVFPDGVTRKVGRLRVDRGDKTVAFGVKATGAVGAETPLFLVATPTNIFTAAGDIVTNFLVRTVRVGEPIVAYPLWVGGVQVFSTNRTDILGDGTASFVGTATNGTLFLTNARITEAVAHPGIGMADIYSGEGFDLTIQLAGSNRVDCARSTSGDYCVFARANLAITGEGTLVAEIPNGYGCGIGAYHDLRIDGATVTVSAGNTGLKALVGAIAISNATVTATSADAYGIYGGFGKRIEIADSVVTATGDECGLYAQGVGSSLAVSGASVVTAEGTGNNDYIDETAFDASALVLGDGLAVTEPAGGAFDADEWCVIDPATGGRARRVVIAPVEFYPLWVGGVQVCTTNRTDILGDGTASFVGTATNGTLFLADATITGTYSFGGSAPPYTAAVYADFDFDLEIALSGLNRVVNTNGTSWGFYPRGNLVIAGDGVLDVEAGTQGIFVSGSLLVRDATVVVDCHSASALGARGIAISNAVVTAVSEGNGPAIESSGDLVIADSTVVSTGIDRSIESFDGVIRISGASRVTAETLQENGKALFAEEGDVVLEGDNGIVAPAGGWVGEHDTSFYAVRAVLDPATGAPATRVVIDTLPPPAITNVVATPNASQGTVALSFFVENDPAVGHPAWNRPVLVVTATDNETGSNYVSATSALSGQTDAAPGTHLVTWDYGAQGIALSSTSVTFAVSYLVMPDWCVVDLSGGKDAARYPVSYLDAPPAGGVNADAFKTTNLALRLVAPGSFRMGPDRCSTTLTNAYYIAVFEATQRQWELVTGKRSSFFKSDTHYATRPVEQVSYDMIRGADAGAGWPASRAVDGDSFLGKLRARTGVDAFDLPTEAQWEYACRAGTSTDYNSGKRMVNESQDANMDEVGRYLYNGGTDGLGNPDCTPDAGTAAVGSYEPNRWELFDFHGNVYEWCLDWSGDLANSANEPVGAPSGTSRVMRGGCWNAIASFCISSRRDSYAPSVSSSNIGFRLARTLSGGTAAERAGEAVAGAERAGTVCAGEAEAVEVVPRFAVTVEGGSTTNTTARAGEIVTVVANAPAEGQTFVEWSADDAMDVAFATPNAPTTTFAMPERTVTAKAVFKDILIDPIPDREWTGSAVEPDVHVRLDGVDQALLPGSDYTVSYTNNVDPGTATATVAMAAPRTGRASATFQIRPPPEPPAVSNVVARQRWPWNGLVDVDYEVGGSTNLLAGLTAQITFTASDGRSWTASNFLAGAEPSAAPGAHRATWDTAADGATNVVAEEVVATVELVRPPAP